MSKTIKGLLFDKDGTLFDFQATWGVWCAGFIKDVSKEDKTVAKALAKAMDYDMENEVFFPSSVMITNSRSEEHTSELQSRRNLVCRLLLEKKKKKIKYKLQKGENTNQHV